MGHVRVRVTDEHGSALGHTAATDDGGRFSLGDLAPDTYVLAAEKSGYCRLASRVILFPVVPVTFNLISSPPTVPS